MDRNGMFIILSTWYPFPKPFYMKNDNKISDKSSDYQSEVRISLDRNPCTMLIKYSLKNSKIEDEDKCYLVGNGSGAYCTLLLKCRRMFVL